MTCTFIRCFVCSPEWNGRSAASGAVGRADHRTGRPPPDPPKSWRLPTGGIRSFGPRHIHQVHNENDSPAVSIHAYSPALATMSYYRELPGEGGIELIRTSTVDSTDALDDLASAPSLGRSDHRDGQA